MSSETTAPTNFLRNIVSDDLACGRHNTVVTRFPPEPNGYLHIGHAKSICLNFGLARDFGGRCHLRFDDTNPVKEETEYIESIKESVRWLGFDWGDNLYHASDYFEQLYQWAEHLVKNNKAYVDDLTPEQMKEYRGTLTEPGKESPFRSRTAEENLDLFRRMRAGEFTDGSKVLRAKIDMSSPNMNMRDPVLYRILHTTHPHVGDKWCIYPMYDFTHGQSDAIEGITHSICTLEFESHRPLYEWFLDSLPVPARPRQYEFARLNLSYTVMSKRKLQELVQTGLVSGWDDPRMPTIMGLKRRGFTPASIRNFCERIGVGRSDAWIGYELLEECAREDLNENAPRAMAVLNPVRLIIDNYPEDKTEEFEVPNHPSKPEQGARKLPFSREILIDADDFMEVPPKGFHRLTVGGEVKLKYAYVVKCTSMLKDENGRVVELHADYDPGSNKGPVTSDGRKIKGVIHWVSARHSSRAEVRLFDRLFIDANPDRSGADYKKFLNHDSITILSNCHVEQSITEFVRRQSYQFERLGYFCIDTKDSTKEHPVLNRIVTLRDTWALTH